MQVFFFFFIFHFYCHAIFYGEKNQVVEHAVIRSILLFILPRCAAVTAMMLRAAYTYAAYAPRCRR